MNFLTFFSHQQKTTNDDEASDVHDLLPRYTIVYRYVSYHTNYEASYEQEPVIGTICIILIEKTYRSVENYVGLKANCDGIQKLNEPKNVVILT
jgi:hypothetical protein